MKDVTMVHGLDGVRGSGGSGGAVAQRLLANGMDPDCLRPWVEVRRNAGGRQIYANDGTPLVQGCYMMANGVVRPVANATLRKDEWLAYDTTALDVLRKRLVGVADLNSRGLTYNLANGLGTTVLEHEEGGDVEGAEMNMTGRSQPRGDAPEWNPAYLPIPIVFAGFDVDIRHLEASRRTGNAVDTTMASLKSRKIADFLETLLFVGTGGITFGGGTIYGYQNHPYRITGSLGGDWTSSAVSALDILDDVLGMVQAARNKNYMGPYVLYTPKNFSTVLDEDYHSGTSGWNGGRSIRDRLRAIEGISDVKTADFLTASNVILVQMTPDVVRMVNGMPLRTVEWDSQGGMVTHYKLMTIQVPQIRRSLLEGNSISTAQNTTSYWSTGVVHYT